LHPPVPGGLYRSPLRPVHCLVLRRSLAIREQAYLALVGVPSLFGSAKLSLKFILDLMRLPADAMQLYLISNPFHVYFTSALTCMSMFSLSTIVTVFLTGLGGLRVRRALISLIIVIVVLSAAVLGLRL